MEVKSCKAIRTGAQNNPGLAMFTLFESKQRRAKDTLEVKRLFSKYGEETVIVLRDRAGDETMPQRDRQHWKRLYRKAKAGQRANSNHVAA